MANLRVVYDNSVTSAKGCVPTATTSAGTLVPANLLTDIKSEVWRSTSTTATITLTWATAQPIHMVALPFTNLTPTATIRVMGYTLPGDPGSVFDTGSVLATVNNFGVASVAANTWGFGGGVGAALWFTGANVRQVTILITDTSNAAGYVEAGRVVAGSYWSPTNNCEVGCDVGSVDMSKHDRADSGDLRTDRGPQYKTLNFELVYMPKADRDAFWSIMRNNAMYKPVFVSLSPENTSDSTEETIFQIYGKLSKMSSLKYQLVNQFSSRMDIEEV